MRTRLALMALVVAAAMSIAGCSGERPGATTRRGAPALTASAPTKSAVPAADIVTSCPSRARASAPRRQRDGATRTMVPGRPIALLACRFHGFNQSQPLGTLAGAAPLPASPIAADLNATPRPPPGAVYSCPADFAETFTLFFSYPSGPPLSVQVNSGGCRYVDNGELRWPFPPVALTLRLEATLGHDDI